jgi:hypothetical protein
MLSIVICNYNKKRISPLKENINSTIGVIYELIIIDNSSNDFSIFKAYNKGVELCKFEKILFIHDDVKFHTIDFGKILVNLNLPNLGVLGIAGAKVKTSISAPWWISNHDYVYGDIIYQYNIQHFSNSTPKKIIEGFETENQVEEVILVDGVFLFSTRDNCLNYPFDETYNSFHFYDLDFSLSLKKNGKRNYVTNSILLEHYSAGSLNKDWVDSSFLFEKKWGEFEKVKSIDDQKKKYLERLAFNSRFRVLLDNKFKKKAIILFLSNMEFLSINNLKYLIRSI